jgi:hypothetical protein
LSMRPAASAASKRNDVMGAATVENLRRPGAS